MHHLALAVRVALIVSIMGYAGVAIVAFCYRDGRAWAVWRAALVSGVLSSVGALIAAMNTPPWPRLEYVMVGLALVALGRFAGALCNIALAFHLQRLIRPRSVRSDLHGDL